MNNTFTLHNALSKMYNFNIFSWYVFLFFNIPVDIMICSSGYWYFASTKEWSLTTEVTQTTWRMYINTNTSN